MTTTNPQPLLMPNDNNKLACDAFVHIQFAPPKNKVIQESDFEKVYVIRHEDADIFVKLESFKRLQFKWIGSIFTIPASGKDCFTWAKEFMDKYPNTTLDTEMAIYCYVKIKI